jgi:hypothetical protein
MVWRGLTAMLKEIIKQENKLKDTFSVFCAAIAALSVLIAGNWWVAKQGAKEELAPLHAQISLVEKDLGDKMAEKSTILHRRISTNDAAISARVGILETKTTTLEKVVDRLEGKMDRAIDLLLSLKRNQVD